MNDKKENNKPGSNKQKLTQFRPYLMAFLIIGTGICVGYLAVRCLDSPMPANHNINLSRNNSSRRSDGGNTSSRVHDLQLHAQSPFDGVVNNMDDEDSESELSNEFETNPETSPNEALNAKAQPVNDSENTVTAENFVDNEGGDIGKTMQSE